MKSLPFCISRLVTALTLVFLTLFLITGCSDNSRTTEEIIASAPPLVTASSNRIPYHGGKLYLLGVNYAWNRYGNDFGGAPESTTRDWTKVDTDFRAMHGQGVGVVRLWVFGDGRSEPKFDAQGHVTGLGPAFLPDIDRLLQIASENKILLVLTLADFSMFEDPIDPKTGGGGHSALVLENSVQQSYLDLALKPLLVRLEASPYKSTVFGIDLINEPEGCTSGFYGTGGIGLDAMKAYVVRSTEYIHTYGPGLYVTLGSATPYWVHSWTGLGLDYYSVHYYPNMDSHDMLAQTLPPGNGLLAYSALGLDRPCVLQEFSTRTTHYGLNDTRPLSARWYLDQSEKLGYAGALGWSYAVHDHASNWKAFAPVLSDWRLRHAALLAPAAGSGGVN